jgi:hypothetical protein
MKEIPLTQGKVALVDDEDYEDLNRYKWCLLPAKYGHTEYAVRYKNISMHQQIMGFTGKDYDHRDRDGLNNQRFNIRECTNSQNQMNTGKRPECSSKYKGVHWNAKRKRWMVSITKDRKNLRLGEFQNEDVAGYVYNQKAKELFGEFALLNDIGGS